MLVRLLYASRAAEPYSDAVLDQILERSRDRNAEHGITGVLCTCQSGQVFLQVLEGARPAVNALYSDIMRDARHAEVTLLDFTEIRERQFAGWRMGSIDMNKVNLRTILRYSETERLDPFSLSGDAAIALLLELISSAAIVSRGDGH